MILRWGDDTGVCSDFESQLVEFDGEDDPLSGQRPGSTLGVYLFRNRQVYD